jgi:hypothetical protein
MWVCLILCPLCVCMSSVHGRFVEVVKEDVAEAEQLYKHALRYPRITQNHNICTLYMCSIYYI